MTGFTQTDRETWKSGGRSPWKTFALVLVSALAGTMLAGCDEPNEYVPPPPPEVTVSQPVQRDVTDYIEMTGTTRAVERVEVRARVRGFLQSVHFEPATNIKKGDLLYVIDPSSFRAQVSHAQADLDRNKASLELAEANYHRTERLYEQNATPQAEFVKAKAARDIAVADVAAAHAVLEEAKLKLGYTEVRAPVSGQVRRNLVSVGNLVGAGENTHLTTLVQYDPILAYFSLNERDLLQLMQQRRTKREANETPDYSGVIHLGLANEVGFPHEGRIDFFDQGVDPQTGTFLLRGSFANPQPYVLLPGMFVRVRAPIANREGALLVPAPALGADQSGRFLLIVNEDNVVERRAVEVGAAIDRMRIIERGLRSDDWVVVKGLLRARPGATVSPKREELKDRNLVGPGAGIIAPEARAEIPTAEIPKT